MNWRNATFFGDGGGIPGIPGTEIILPETHIAPEKWWFAIGIRYVSLQECKHFQLSNGFDS